MRGLESPVFSTIHVELPTQLAYAAHSKAVFMMGKKISWSRFTSYSIQKYSRLLLKRRRSCWICINNHGRH